MTGAILLLAAVAAAAPTPDWESSFAEMRSNLSALIRLDTSNPPGNELVAARWLEDVLKKDGIPSRVHVSSGTRASLIARLAGSGRKRPLLLICHTDVVPVERDKWTVDPFGAVVKDGYLYGRGAADIKGMCAAELQVLLRLKRSGARLDRDVVFFAQADEEVGGRDRHLTWLLQEHGSELDAEFGINEGGHTLWRDGRIAAVNLQAAEKQFLDVRLVARGTSGHASIPRPDNAVFTLSRALARLSEWRPDASANPVARAYLEKTVLPGDEPRHGLIRRLAGRAGSRAAEELARTDLEARALLTDTVNATMVTAGFKSNVVPSEASAVVNCRLLPGRDPAAFVRDLTAAAGEPSLEVTFETDGLPPIPSMPLDSALVLEVERAASELSPPAPVVPFMSAWSTDAQALRARGVLVYGFDPPLSLEDADRAHGHDERISLDGLNAYLRLLERVVRGLAEAS